MGMFVSYAPWLRFVLPSLESTMERSARPIQTCPHISRSFKPPLFINYLLLRAKKYKQVRSEYMQGLYGPVAVTCELHVLCLVGFVALAIIQ